MLIDYVKEWMDARKQASATKEQPYKKEREHTAVFKQYTDFCHMTPEQLIEEAKQDIKATERRIVEFRHWCLESKDRPVKFNTARTNEGLIRGFYTYNSIHFSKAFKMPVPKPSGTRKTYSKLEAFNHDEQGRITGLNDVICDFLKEMNQTHKAIAFCLLTTGQKAGEILNLNVDFVYDNQGQITEKERLFLDTERVKTRFPVSVFLSKEATAELKRYVRDKRKNAKPNDPLFLEEAKHKGAPRRMSAKAISDAFRRRAQSMGLINSETKENPLDPTRFRHIFKEACDETISKEDVIKSMMGHKQGIGGTYSNYTETGLLQYYLAVEPLLSVYKGGNGNNPISVQKIEALEESLRVQHLEIMEQDKKLTDLSNIIMGYKIILTKITEQQIRLGQFTDITQLKQDKLEQKPKAAGPKKGKSSKSAGE